MSEREYAVLSWHPREGVRFAGPGIGQSWTTEERAREHYAWMTGEWREEVRAAAEENEASGFKGGNEAWHVWNNERTGKKYLRFAIASRPVPEPATIEEAEEGFSV